VSHPETPGSDVRPTPSAPVPETVAPDTGVTSGASPEPDATTSSPSSKQSSTARFGLAWRNGEFRALWFADTISAIGSQVSRVALALLVYSETGSPTASLGAA
jgi:hypothetical protein